MQSYFISQPYPEPNHAQQEEIKLIFIENFLHVFCKKILGNCCKIESNKYVKGRERKRKQRQLRWFSHEDLHLPGKRL